MRHDRLKLVRLEDTLPAATDSSADAFAVVTTQDAPVRALRVVDADADEGPLPDDAA
jgi:hypothetical protein